ncbi:MAG: serine protease [Desulfovibrio sp.]|jgi:S1-C subfamily serine protease|nr:serine protease [Desulfovibrio sp.]
MNNTDQTPRAQSKSGFAAVVACSMALLLAMGVALYLRATAHTANAERDLTAIKAEEEKQATANAALLAEKQRLEAMLGKPPCEIKELLGSGADKTPPAPVPATTPATNTDVPPTSQAPTPQAAETRPVVDIVEDATVFILAFDQAGNIVTGSGFFFAPNLVLTNKHVAQNHEAGLFIINKKLNAPVQAKMVAMSISPTRDYAVLQVSAPATASIAPLKFATTVQRAEKIGAWGYPHAVSKNDPKYRALMTGQAITAPELSYSDGSVSAIHESDPPRIVHTAPLSPGNSGGPLTNNNGNVLGINTLISLDNESYRQTSFALSSSDILKFLSEHGITATQAQ